MPRCFIEPVDDAGNKQMKTELNSHWKMENER